MPLPLSRPSRASPYIALARAFSVSAKILRPYCQTNKSAPWEFQRLLTRMSIQHGYATRAAVFPANTSSVGALEPSPSRILGNLRTKLANRTFRSAVPLGPAPAFLLAGKTKSQGIVGQTLLGNSLRPILGRPVRRHTSSVVVVRAVVADSPMDPMQGKSVGFIGAGQMAEALARGWDKQGLLPASRMVCTDVNEARLEVFRSFGVTTCRDSMEVALQSDIIFLAVKPFTVQKVLTELRDVGSLMDGHVIVSIAAGVTLDNLQSWAGETVRVVRVMPNTPCLVGQTAAAMSVGAHATAADADLVRRMFATVGTIHSVEEKLLDAVTGLSGSGPAYVFVAIEALADGGVAAGLPRDVALSLAAQTVLGSAQMVVETGKHPGVLKDQVASPGGTTIAGLHELEKGGFRALLMNAVVAAAKRSKEMS